MKLIYCIYFVVFCGIAAANQSDPPAVINAYSNYLLNYFEF